MSYTTTQYVAAAAVPESCAVAPAWVLTDAFVSNEHDAPLGTPTPRPMKIVDGGPAGVSVMSI
jgi:hypothetical protein